MGSCIQKQPSRKLNHVLPQNLAIGCLRVRLLDFYPKDKILKDYTKMQSSIIQIKISNQTVTSTLKHLQFVQKKKEEIQRRKYNKGSRKKEQKKGEEKEKQKQSRPPVPTFYFFLNNRKKRYGRNISFEVRTGKQQTMIGIENVNKTILRGSPLRIENKEEEQEHQNNQDEALNPQKQKEVLADKAHKKEECYPLELSENKEQGKEACKKKGMQTTFEVDLNYLQRKGGSLVVDFYYRPTPYYPIKIQIFRVLFESISNIDRKERYSVKITFGEETYQTKLVYLQNNYIAQFNAETIQFLVPSLLEEGRVKFMRKDEKSETDFSVGYCKLRVKDLVELPNHKVIQKPLNIQKFQGPCCLFYCPIVGKLLGTEYSQPQKQGETSIRLIQQLDRKPRDQSSSRQLETQARKIYQQLNSMKTTRTTFNFESLNKFGQDANIPYKITKCPIRKQPANPSLPSQQVRQGLLKNSATKHVTKKLY